MTTTSCPRRLSRAAAALTVLTAALLATSCASTPDSADRVTPAADPTDELLAAASQGDILTPDDDAYDLRYVETIQPGTKISVDRSDGSQKDCSIGWIVTGEALHGSTGALTAGHCGNVGDTVSVKRPGAGTETIGTLTAVSFDAQNPQRGGDYGLITLTGTAADSVTGTVEGKTPATAVQPVDSLSTTEPYLCARGYHGTTCGPFLESPGPGVIYGGGDTQPGDSGGPVWAQSAEDPTEITPVGIVQGTRSRDNIMASKPLHAALANWGLKLAT